MHLRVLASVILTLLHLHSGVLACAANVQFFHSEYITVDHKC